MSMSKEITLTPEGGKYYSALAFHWASMVLVFPFVVAILLIAIINPFWFRDSMFNSVERRVNEFTRWRNYLKYKIYLGCDPKMWHTLNGDLK
jgi:hypothetical protein